MGLKTAKRLAADIMSVGETRIWVDPERLEDLESAVTREDVRRLIKDGAIRRRPPSNPSRRKRAKIMRAKMKGRRPGLGSRKGGGIVRETPWVDRVRAQRRLLRDLREKGKISKRQYRFLYSRVKGGVFVSRKDLLAHAGAARAAAERQG